MQPSSSRTAVRLSAPAERPRIEALLMGDALPVAGLGHPGMLIWVAESDGQVVGAAGLEVHGSFGLLRSVVVERSRRGEGLGARLTEAVLEAARARGLRSLFLLTTTAEAYFPRFGFQRVARSEVPAPLGASEELRGACPATAVVMGRLLS